MATLTITLAGAGTLNPIVKTLSASDLTKLQTAFTEILQDSGVASPTTQQIFAYWVSRWASDTVAIVREQQQRDAIATVENIVLT